MLDVLAKIAEENQYNSFCATVLRENAAMIHVFKKRFPNAEVSINSGSDIHIVMEFDGSDEDAQAARDNKI